MYLYLKYYHEFERFYPSLLSVIRQIMLMRYQNDLIWYHNVFCLNVQISTCVQHRLEREKYLISDEDLIIIKFIVK